MKTKNVVLTVAVMIIVTAFTFAQEPAYKMAVVSNNTSGIFKVIYSGTTPGIVSLKVYDDSGHLIFAETNGGMIKFIRPLNFIGLESGEYSIQVADKTGTQTQKVTYDAEKVSSTGKIKSHVTKLQEGKYLLSVDGHKTEKVNVTIYDGEGNVVHNQKLDVKGNLGVVYNLKQVQGQPTFEVTGH